jgi:hypothetical protein
VVELALNYGRWYGRVALVAAFSMPIGEAVIRPVAVNPFETISNMEMISLQN